MQPTDVRLGVILHEKQEIINQHPARFKVVKAGKRFGKTKLSLYRAIRAAGKWPNEVVWILCPTYAQAKKIAWFELSWIIPRNLIRRKVETELLIELVNGARIQLIGCDNADALRGPRLRHVVFDECSYIDADVWPTIISGQLLGVDKKSTADFISSPNKNGRNWFSNFFDQAKIKMQNGDPDWAAFYYTIYDNPTLDREEIEKIKEQNTSDTWDLEYMGIESALAGQLYWEFDPNKHIGIRESKHALPLYRGIDWGLSHPSVCLWAEVDLANSMVYILDEFFKSDYVIEETCQAIIRMTGERQAEWTVIDPSTAKRNSIIKTRDMDEFTRCGVPVIPADNRSRGVDILKMFFKKDRILIHPRCKNTILQLKNLQREDKEGDDCPDVLRYIVLKIHDSIRGMNIQEIAPKFEPAKPDRPIERELNVNDRNIFNEDRKSPMSWVMEEVS